MFNYFKKIFFIFFIFLYIRPSYTMEGPGINYPTNQLSLSKLIYKTTGYECTKNLKVNLANDKLHHLMEKIICPNIPYNNDPSAELNAYKQAYKEAYNLKNLEKIKKYLKQGADYNSRESHNHGLLFILINILKNNPEQFAKNLEEFIQYGLDINEYINNSDTALTYVVHAGHCDPKHKLWKFLIDKGAKINMRDRYNLPPLSIAINTANIEAIQDLLDYGINVNERDENGTLPLVHAINTSNRETVKFLLEHNSQITDIKNNQDTAFHCIAQNYSLNAMQIIETIIIHAKNFDSYNQEKQQNNVVFIWSPTSKKIEFSEQFNTRINLLWKILQLTDAVNKKTAARLLNDVYPTYYKNKLNGEEYLKLEPLFNKFESLLNGTQLKKDYFELESILTKSQPKDDTEIMNLISQHSSSNNLVRNIINSYKTLT